MRLALALAFGLAAPMAAAHPHIFVDTGLRFVHGPDGRLVALEISWTYDELFSLLLLEDRGLDADFDGALTEDETEALQGFDMDWPEDYEGDVYVTAAGLPVALGPPEPGRAELLEDGRLVGRHTRRLAQAVDGAAEAVVVRVYDQSFYTAYEISVDAVGSDAAGCHVEVFTPDLDAAYAQLEAALEELMGSAASMDEELDFPPVGDRFAEEARLVCTGGS